jgi:hypothetical protein
VLVPHPFLSTRLHTDCHRLGGCSQLKSLFSSSIASRRRSSRRDGRVAPRRHGRYASGSRRLEHGLYVGMDDACGDGSQPAANVRAARRASDALGGAPAARRRPRLLARQAPIPARLCVVRLHRWQRVLPALVGVAGGPCCGGAGARVADRGDGRHRGPRGVHRLGVRAPRTPPSGPVLGGCATLVHVRGGGPPAGGSVRAPRSTPPSPPLTPPPPAGACSGVER